MKRQVVLGALMVALAAALGYVVSQHPNWLPSFAQGETSSDAPAEPTDPTPIVP